MTSDQNQREATSYPPAASPPNLDDAHWVDSFGTRPRPTAIAVFTGVDESLRDSVEARVLADRSRWRTNDARGTSPFHTLGSPTYIRGSAPLAPEPQRFLRHRYGDVHQVLVDQLSAILAADVTLSADDSAPGFHIFEADAGAVHPAVGLHLDVQFRHLDQPREHRVTSDTASSRLISATIVIRADGGAGLDYVPRPHVPGLAMRTEPTRHLVYEPGRLVLQFGLFPHSVAAFGVPRRGSQLRITLQAHAIQGAGGAWRLYW